VARRGRGFERTNVRDGPSVAASRKIHRRHVIKRNVTKKFEHICWDGCMFPNEVMMKQQTWNDILEAMVAVRDAHGWKE